MLSRAESEVMKAVYDLCDGCESCLISAAEISSLLPKSRRYTSDKIDGALSALQNDGYFDLILSQRKGERVYLVNLKENGFLFKRTLEKQRRDIAFRILLAFIGAASTFIFGLILKSIFG